MMIFEYFKIWAKFNLINLIAIKTFYQLNFNLGIWLYVSCVDESVIIHEFKYLLSVEKSKLPLFIDLIEEAVYRTNKNLTNHLNLIEATSNLYKDILDKDICKISDKATSKLWQNYF